MSGDERRRADGARLAREDWLAAAFDAVADVGLARLRVLSLARTLGVTRGSFYWHFADHAALVAALLERWRAGELDAIRTLAADAGDDPRDALVRLLDAALARRGAELREMRFELALRAAERRDPQVGAILAEVDAARTALFEAKFRRLTGDAVRAAELAALFYATVAGATQALARPSMGARRAAWLRGVIVAELIDRQRPAAAAASAARRRARPRRVS